MSTYLELKAQLAELNKTIEKQKPIEEMEAMQTIRTLIRDFGFSRQDVFPVKKHKRVKTAEKA